MNQTITVNFDGIYPIGKFNYPPKGEELIPKMKFPGVYIWGFAYERGSYGKIGRQLDGTESFSEDKHVFIPYYVGQSSKSIYGCFSGRHGNIAPKSVQEKYTILSDDYLKKFYNDPFFPENIGKNANCPKEKKEWFWYPKHPIGPDYYKGKIVYHNNRLILKHLYDLKDLDFPQKKVGYPFPELIKALRNDGRHPLASSIEAHGNVFFKKMYFCFTSNLTTSEINKQFTLRDWEAFTFYSLKGKTVSQHNSYKGVKKKFSGVQVQMTAPGKIFKPEMSNAFKCRY